MIENDDIWLQLTDKEKIDWTNSCICLSAHEVTSLVHLGRTLGLLEPRK